MIFPLCSKEWVREKDGERVHPELFHPRNHKSAVFLVLSFSMAFSHQGGDKPLCRAQNGEKPCFSPTCQAAVDRPVLSAPGSPAQQSQNTDCRTKEIDEVLIYE